MENQFGLVWEPSELIWNPALGFMVIVGILIATLVALLLLPGLRGLRTWLFAGISSTWLAIVPLLADWIGYLQGLDWTQYVTKEYAPFVVLAVNLAFFFLRWLTTRPVAGLDRPPPAAITLPKE